MALTIGELVAYITADDDGFRRGVRGSRRELEGLTRDATGRLHDMHGRFVAEGERAGRGFGDGISRGGGRGLKLIGGLVGGLIGRLGDLVKPAISAGLAIATIGTAAISAAPLLAPVAVALFEIGQAAVAAAPALLALGVAGKLVQASLTKIFEKGSAARKALEPLGAALNRAAEAGSNAAARGIRPLAEELRRAAFPTVQRYMVDIGTAANTVQRRFLEWAKSTSGVKTLGQILGPIGTTVRGLSGEVADLAIAFVKMLGRIMAVSTAAGETGLSAVLRKLTEVLNGINADTVQSGLDKLKSTFSTVAGAASTVIGWIRKLVEAYKLYTTEFGVAADAVSIAAIVFGGPAVAAAGAAGLIIRHFDQLKAAYQRLKAAFTGGGGKGVLGEFMGHARAAAQEVLPALKTAFVQIRDAVLPVLQTIGKQIKEEVIPAFGEFIEAASPVVSWLVGVLGPVVANTFANILRIISGAIDIIVGIFKIFTGVLTGDWSKAWEGVVSIAKGIGKILGAIIRQAVNIIKGAWSLAIGLLKGIMKRAVDGAVGAAKGLGRGVAAAFRAGWGAIRGAAGQIKDRVVGFFKGAPRWLVNAGRAIVRGLADGIGSMASTAINKLKGLAGQLRGLLPFSPAKEGPFSGSGAPELSGRAIVADLAKGIVGGTGAVTSAMHSALAAAMPAPVLPAAAPMSAPAAAARGVTRLDVRFVSDGTPIGAFLVKHLRPEIRDRGGDVQIALGPKGRR